MASNAPEHEHREDEETAANEDEDTGAQVAPIVKLEEVAVTTGEEDEDAILDLCVYIYFCVSVSAVYVIFISSIWSVCRFLIHF